MRGHDIIVISPSGKKNEYESKRDFSCKELGRDFVGIEINNS